MCWCCKPARTARPAPFRATLRRLLRQWWADEKMHWRVIWHVLHCARGGNCYVWGVYTYTGGSFSSSSARLDKLHWGRCRSPHQFG